MMQEGVKLDGAGVLGARQASVVHELASCSAQAAATLSTPQNRLTGHSMLCWKNMWTALSACGSSIEAAGSERVGRGG